MIGVSPLLQITRETLGKSSIHGLNFSQFLIAFFTQSKAMFSRFDTYVCTASGVFAIASESFGVLTYCKKSSFTDTNFVHNGMILLSSSIKPCCDDSTQVQVQSPSPFSISYIINQG